MLPPNSYVWPLRYRSSAVKTGVLLAVTLHPVLRGWAAQRSYVRMTDSGCRVFPCTPDQRHSLITCVCPILPAQLRARGWRISRRLLNSNLWRKWIIHSKLRGRGKHTLQRIKDKTCHRADNLTRVLTRLWGWRWLFMINLATSAHGRKNAADFMVLITCQFTSFFYFRFPRCAVQVTSRCTACT